MACFIVLILWVMFPVTGSPEIMNPQCVGVIKSSRLFVGLIGFVTPLLASISSVSFVHYPTSGLTAKRSGFLRGFYLVLTDTHIPEKGYEVNF